MRSGPNAPMMSILETVSRFVAQQAFQRRRAPPQMRSSLTPDARAAAGASTSRNLRSTSRLAIFHQPFMLDHQLPRVLRPTLRLDCSAHGDFTRRVGRRRDEWRASHLGAVTLPPPQRQCVLMRRRRDGAVASTKPRSVSAENLPFRTTTAFTTFAPRFRATPLLPDTPTANQPRSSAQARDTTSQITSRAVLTARPSPGRSLSPMPEIKQSSGPSPEAASPARGTRTTTYHARPTGRRRR